MQKYQCGAVHSETTILFGDEGYNGCGVMLAARAAAAASLCDRSATLTSP